MAELPILPLNTGLLLGDTGHLSPEEFGAYCRILFTMWQHGGRLSDDDQELARIAGVYPRRWAKIKARVLRPITAGGGQLSQKRLSSTWLKVQELRRKKAKAANARWAPEARALEMHLHSIGSAIKTKINSSSFLEDEEESGWARKHRQNG